MNYIMLKKNETLRIRCLFIKTQNKEFYRIDVCKEPL